VEPHPAPIWQKALPFIVLLPTAAITNGSLASLAIVLLTLAVVRPSRGPTLSFLGESWVRDAAIGILAGLILWLCSDQIWDPLLSQWLGPIKLDSLSGVRGNVLNYLVLMAIAFLYGGLVEELVFRGFVIGWGSSLLGPRSVVPLVLLSSAVFGSAHFYQGLSGAISTGLIGLGLALLYVGTGKRLLAPVLAHMVLDAIGVTEIFLGING